MIGNYHWVERPNRRDDGSPCTAGAACITVALAASAKHVVEAFGVDPSSRRLATFHEAEDMWSEDATPVQIWESGEKTIAVEPNGYLASLPEHLEKIARQGDAVSVFWNVNAVMQVLVMRGGVVVREFDPLLYDEDGPHLPEEMGLAFGTTGQPRSAALAFLERCTGFSASEDEILRARRPTYLAPAHWLRS
jgi:hypothetical protein